MENRKEALRIRAELALWSGRKAIHQPRLKTFQSKYILEQDDVYRLQRGIFSRWKRNYEEKLEKEQEEMAAAKMEWEKMSAMMKEADEKLPLLEQQAKSYEGFWQSTDTSVIYGEEKATLEWCCKMEDLKEIVIETNACIELARRAMGNDTFLEGSPLPMLQSRAETLHKDVNAFFAERNMAERLPSWESMLYYLYSVQSFGTHYGRNSIEDVQLAIATNNALFNLDEALKSLRERLVEIFTDFEEEGERLLQRMGSGESHFCEKEQQETVAEKKEQRTIPGGLGLFDQMDLSKEKERVLFGLSLLQKEFEKIGGEMGKTTFGKMFIRKADAMLEAEIENMAYWERLLRDWQLDLKQYRKNAGNFSCALDKYESFEKKAWKYTEEEQGELQQAYQEHMQETAERLMQSEEQIRTHEK